MSHSLWALTLVKLIKFFALILIINGQMWTNDSVLKTAVVTRSFLENIKKKVKIV